MMKSIAILLSSAAALAIACGSSSSTPDAKVFKDAPGSGSGSGFMLTVKNAPLGTPWCKVSVNGGAASLAATQTMAITAAGNITLTATPEGSGFELSPNMWHHTSGDTAGSGEAGTVSNNTSTAMVAVTTTANACVWVCCPFSPGGNGCPTTDQCP